MKKNRGFRITALILLLAMVLTPFAGVSLSHAFTPDTAAREAYEKKLQEAKEKKEELERSRREAERLIEKYSEQKDDAEAYIEELDLKLNDMSLKIFETQTRIKETEEELARTRDALEAAKQKERDQYATMKARIKYIYENGETTIMDVFLSSEGIGDMLNQIEYLQDIQEYDNSLLERYKAAKQEVADHEALVEATLENYNTLLEQEEFDRATVQELYDLKAAEIEAITEKLGITDEHLFDVISEISDQNAEIDKIIAAEEERMAEEERLRKEEEERLRREEEARKEAERKAAEAAQNRNNSGNKSVVKDYDAINKIVLTDETDPYKMIWPLPGDHQTFTKWGYRNINVPGATSFHRGWDIGGDFGWPIVAVLAGTVVGVGYNSSAGNYVRIDHGNGYETVYFHQSKQLVAVGDYVQQGQTIGLVGSTGVSSGPHLHFGIKVNGNYVDPDPYIGPLE